MERLTKRIEGGQAVFHECHGTCGTCDGANCYCIGPMVDRLAAYEDSGLEPEETADFMKRWERAVEIAGLCKKGGIDHLLELKKAEQDGRLVVLPCKVGDHVWIDGRDAIVTEFFGYRSERYFHAVILGRNKHIDIPFTEIGKTVFLTREEAEAALKGGDG